MPTSDQGNIDVSSPGRRLALIVGVNEASQTTAYLAPLQFAESSATSMAEVLQEKCNFEIIKTLIGAEATTAAMQGAIRKLAMHRTNQDFLLLYFTGHGYPMADEAGQHNVYLVTEDFDPAEIEELDDGALSLGWLSEILYKKAKAGSVLIILDCCYGGNFNALPIDRPLDTIHNALKQYFSSASSQSTGKTRGTLAAAGRDAVAWERDGYSVMTRYLLKALCGEYLEAVDENGQVTLERLQETLRKKMSPDQELSFSGEIVGTPLILATFEGLSIQARREHERAVQYEERVERLRAMLADHDGFMQDRLASFVGREKELADLDQRIREQLSTGGYLTITGQPGQGKSSIIARMIDMYSKEQGGLDRVIYHFIPLSPGPDHQVALLRNLLARLILKYSFSEIYVDSASRAALREAFPEVLKKISEKGKREIIFIDGLDQLETEMTGHRDLTFLPHGIGNPPVGIVFVLGTRPNDTLRPLELLEKHKEFLLPNLSRDDFDRVLVHRGVWLKPAIADRFYEQLEKNALYLDLVAKELAARSSITSKEIAQIIQQITDNPENLFLLATDRLSKQEMLWKEIIKPVLGLLLVTNEPLSRQQIKQLINLTMPIQIDGEQLNRGLELLGGLVITDGLHRYTLFHLKFRDYLRQDLSRPDKRYIFDHEDEQGWQQRIIVWCERDGLAHIWEDVRTDPVEQERRNYARQHYITHLYSVDDWTKLFNVLDEGMYGRAKVQYDPSTRSYALDLELGRQAASSERWNLDRAIEHLPHLWRYTLLRCSLASRADNYSVEAFRLMLLLDQETKALGLAELITDPIKKAEAFTLIGSYFVTHSEREREARQLFTRAEAIAMAIKDGNTRAKALINVAAVYAQLGLWTQAEAITGSIIGEWEHDEAVVTLAIEYAQAAQWQKAERAVAAIVGEAKRDEALTDEWGHAMAMVSLAVAYSQAGLLSQASHAWQEAEEYIRTIQGEWWQVKAVMALATGYAQARQWPQAKATIATITDRWQRVKALLVLAMAYVQVGQVPQAQRVWHEAEAIITAVQGGAGRVMALATLAAAFTLAGQTRQAGKVWQEAEAIIASIQGDTGHAEASAALAMAYTQIGQTQRIEATIASIQQGGVEETEVLVALATAYAQVGQWTQAKQTITDIQDSWGQAKAMAALAIAYAQAGEWQEAEKFTVSITNQWQRMKAQVALVTAYAQAGQVQRAVHVQQQIEAIIANTQDKWGHVMVRDTIATALATNYAQIGQWRQAEETIASISDGEAHVEALTILANILVSMSQQGYIQSSQGMQDTPQQLAMTLELITEEKDGDPALANAMGRNTVLLLQQEGYIVHPVYTGQKGGIFVEVGMTIIQLATIAWDNHAVADEVIADLSGLITIFGAILPVIKNMVTIHEQRVGKEESLARPIKISLVIDGVPLSIEAPDVTQADAALKLALQFRVTHPTIAPQVTMKSKIEAQGRIPTPKRGHGRSHRK